MGLFKRAAVRGIAHELVRRKMAQFPSKQAMDEAADAVADHMPEAAPEASPEVSPEGGHSPEAVVAIANRLMEIAQQLMSEVGAAGGAEASAPGAPPPAPEAVAAKEAAEGLFKMASESTYEDVASAVAVDLMEKAAAEVKQAGSLIQGGDKGNTASQATKVTEIGALDAKNRPEGKYHTGVGKTELDTNKGAIGDHSKHPDQPGATVTGSNSITQDVGKKAALDEAIAKIAGSLIQGGDKKNTPEAATSVTEIGKLDKKNRPEGYAHVGQGNTNFSEPQAARVGIEKKPDVMPHNTPSGTNSVIQASKAASDLSVEDQAFLQIFSKCASEVGAQLPEAFSVEQKTAAIRHMMGMSADERKGYIESLGGAKVAAVEGSLMDKLREIAAAK